MPAERLLLILIPTYNEAENVEPLFEGIRSLGLQATLLFVNDRSTDGTDEILQRIAGQHSWVQVLQRDSKQGIGSAHLAGIDWAYQRGYRLLLTMDADFTHSPASIPAFLDKADACDVVIASRFLEEDSLPGWNLSRRFLTHLGHVMTRLLLRMPLDATGAFRLYRLDRIPRRLFDLVGSRGYSFFFESLFILWFNGASIIEIPIVLSARIQGHSKMVVTDAIQSLRFLLRLFRRKIFARATLRCPLPEKGQPAAHLVEETRPAVRTASAGGEGTDR
ncbi:MAG: glycosyltransferase [Bryobacteraceae bacterium]